MGKYELRLATLLAGLAIAGGISPVAAAIVPMDYFAEAIAQVQGNSLPGSWDNVSPVPGITTGVIAGPIAAIVNPVTTTYSSNGVLLSEGNASATADFSDGTLHARGGVTNDPFGFGFVGSGIAQFGDTLHFTNLTASAVTVTTVKFSVHLDGILSDFLTGCCTSSGNALVQLRLGIGDPSVLGNSVGFNPATDNIVTSGNVNEFLYGGPRTVDENFSSEFSFRGPSANAGIFMFLQAQGQYQYSDFGQTASFSFDPLPSGVSYTSASGVFLTGSSVPEPSTWAMLIFGFGGLGFAGYRTSRKPVSIAA